MVFGSEFEEEGGEGGPLVVEGAGGCGVVGKATGAAVPVVGVVVVALFAVEIGVDAAGFGGIDVLGDGVGAVPVAVGVVPEGVEEWRQGGGFRGGERAELGGGHEVIMAPGWRLWRWRGSQFSRCAFGLHDDLGSRHLESPHLGSRHQGRNQLPEGGCKSRRTKGRILSGDLAGGQAVRY